MDHPVRHPTLYAQRLFRTYILWPIGLLGIGIVFGTVNLVMYRSWSRAALWLPYIPMALAYLAALYFMRWRNFALVDEDGLHVSRALRSQVIPFDGIRTARVSPLKQAFRPEDGRARMMSGPYRNLAETPATIVRLKADDEALASLHKALGRRYAYRDYLALPVHDADGLAREITAHLPSGPAAVQGKRKRGRS